MLFLCWNPKSLADALITVNLLIVATVLWPGIHAITLWVLLSAKYKMMPFSVWGSYLFMTLERYRAFNFDVEFVALEDHGWSKSCTDGVRQYIEVLKDCCR